MRGRRFSFLISVVSLLFFCFAAAVSAQDGTDDFTVLGGGGLDNEPPFVMITTEREVDFYLRDIKRGSDGSFNLDLFVGDMASSKDICVIPVKNGELNLTERSDFSNCKAVVYQASWENTAIPADADLISVGFVFGDTSFSASRKDENSPGGIARLWNSLYLKSLALNFYGKDGAMKTDLMMDSNLSYFSTIRSESRITIGIANFVQSVCHASFDTVVYKQFEENAGDLAFLHGYYANGKFVHPGDHEIGSNRFVSKYEVDFCSDDPMSPYIPSEKPWTGTVGFDLGLPIVRVDYLTADGQRGIWEAPILNFLTVVLRLSESGSLYGG